MKSSKVNHKFRAQIDEESFRGKAKGWKIEILMYLLLSIFFCFFGLSRLPEGKILSSQVGLPLLIGVALLYFLISVTLGHIANYIEMRDEEIKLLKRQLTRFICEASLGWVEKEDLNRLRKAATSLVNGEDNLTVDDFYLISRAYIFWGKKGFEWQDDTKCINCGRTREEHSQDGNCPTK